MNKIFSLMLLLPLSCAVCAGDSAGDWKKPFSDADATRGDIVALWEFKPGFESADSSPNGIALQTRGRAIFVPDGVFGGNCLESFSTSNTESMGAVGRKKISLQSPGGIIAVECWVKLKNESFSNSEIALAVLVDCKGVYFPKKGAGANSGFAFYLAKNARGKTVPMVNLGFGDDSVIFQGTPLDLAAGEWHNLSFVYDGEGRCGIFLDGSMLSISGEKGRRVVADPSFPVTIGERATANYIGFPGFIGQVRISTSAPAYLPMD